MNEPKEKLNGKGNPVTTLPNNDTDLIALLSNQEVSNEILAEYRPAGKTSAAEFHIRPLARVSKSGEQLSAAAKRDIARAYWRHGLDYDKEVVPILREEWEWDKTRISEFRKIILTPSALKLYLSGAGYKRALNGARGKKSDDHAAATKLLKRFFENGDSIDERYKNWVIYIGPRHLRNTPDGSPQPFDESKPPKAVY